MNNLVYLINEMRLLSYPCKIAQMAESHMTEHTMFRTNEKTTTQVQWS